MVVEYTFEPTAVEVVFLLVGVILSCFAVLIYRDGRCGEYLVSAWCAWTIN